MDLSDIIITLVIMGVALLTGGKKGKKAAAGQQAKQGRPQANRPAWEAVFGGTVHDDVRENENAQSEVRNNKARNKGRRQQGSYFSYEDPSQNWESNQHEASQPIANKGAEENREVLVAGEAFDLRKAFVYQTIMERVDY